MIGKEILKKAEAMEKSIHEEKTELVYFCVREKNNSFEITVIILRYIRNVNFSDSKRILKLPKFPFFFTLETVLKMTKETNKGNVESICARVIKPASKKVANAEVDLN